MTIGPRLLSALLLTAGMGALYWLTPNLSPEMFGATTPERTALFFTALFANLLGLSHHTGIPDLPRQHRQLKHSQSGQHYLRPASNRRALWHIPALRRLLARFSCEPHPRHHDYGRCDLRRLDHWRRGLEDQSPYGRVQGGEVTAGRRMVAPQLVKRVGFNATVAAFGSEAFKFVVVINEDRLALDLKGMEPRIAEGGALSVHWRTPAGDRRLAQLFIQDDGLRTEYGLGDRDGRWMQTIGKPSSRPGT